MPWKDQGSSKGSKGARHGVQVGDKLTPSEAAKRIQEIVSKLANVALTAGETQARRENIWPYEDELEIRWSLKRNVKVYTITCGPCGENRFLTWQNGIRCKNCYKFHAYTAFLKAQEKTHKLHRWNDGLIERIRQPEVPKRLILLDGRPGKGERMVDLTGLNPDKRRKAMRDFLRV